MGQEFEYDVFLSHNTADKPPVRRLAERLRTAGLRVWFDEWVIQPGDDIYLAIERGLEASRTLVLCLSRAALGSDWVTLERSTVLFRDPSNAGRRCIPLLLAECKLPDTLRRYKYVDLRQEADGAFRELLKACSPQVEPRNPPATPGQPGKLGALIASSIKRQDPLLDRADLIQVGALDLCAKLKGVPPLGEEEFKKHYKGFWVRWWTTLSSAATHWSDPVLCQLQLLPEEPEGYTTPIECTVRLADYPVLKVLQRGSRLRVLGQIGDFDLFSVRLENVKLELPDKDEPAVRFTAAHSHVNSPSADDVIASNADPNRRLTKLEIYKLVNRYIGVNGGYLGDFSYRTHRDFYLELDLDIAPDNFDGTTRQRFIKILSESTAEVQARILDGIMNRYPVGSSELRTRERRDEIAGWIARLISSLRG